MLLMKQQEKNKQMAIHMLGERQSASAATPSELEVTKGMAGEALSVARGQHPERKTLPPVL